ncbi:hypothetical protein Tco_1278616, partial [Tanacetum coccineum]
RTPGMKLFKIGTSKRKSLDEEYVSKQERKSDKTKPMFDDSDFAKLDVDNAMKNVEALNVSTIDPSTSAIGDIFEDEMMTITDTFVAIRSTRPRTTSVVIRDVEEEPMRATLVPTVQSQDKARMEADALLAARLQEKERERFSIDKQARFLVGTIAERKRSYMKRSRSGLRIFIPMDSEEGRKKAASCKKRLLGLWKSVDFVIHVTYQRPRAEPDEESVKRQKIGETSGSGEEQSAEKIKELSEEELQKLLVVVPVEEVYVEALQVKYPIINWEVYSDDTRRYWRIIRVGNHIEAYQIFADMFKKFDRDDLIMMILFYRALRYMHDPLVWRLYDTCGVHHESSVRGHDIFMLVKKEYPLTRGALGLMMVARLLVEADNEYQVLGKIVGNNGFSSFYCWLKKLITFNDSPADPSTSTAGDIFENEILTIADILVAIRSIRPRTTSVVIRDVEEEPRRATPVPIVQSQEKAQFEREQRIARERAAEQGVKDAALITEFEDVHARMDADALLAAKLQDKERDFEEIQKLYEKEQNWIKNFIPMDSEEGGKKAASSKKRPRAEPDEESVKRQKIGETSSSVEEVYVEVLQVKYPIIDWVVYSEDTRRDDIVKLWDLVKKRLSTTDPTNDKEKELWVELKRLVKPDNDDIMLKLQRYMHDPLVWRLYDNCGVHYVSSVRGHDIFMLVEKEYPLTRGTLGLMMVARLLVEADSEMSRELLRKIFYQANRL